VGGVAPCREMRLDRDTKSPSCVDAKDFCRRGPGGFLRPKEKYVGHLKFLGKDVQFGDCLNPLEHFFFVHYAEQHHNQQEEQNVHLVDQLDNDGLEKLK
jgi:hypothetical protein